MGDNRLNLPPNIVVPLQAIGYDQQILAQMPYAQGVIAVLKGQTKPDGDILTADLVAGMQNTGLTVDDLSRFLVGIESNMNAFITANPGMNQTVRNTYTTMYFSFFLEYLRVLGSNSKYYPLEDIVKMFSVRGVDITQALDMEKYNKGMYALSIKNPVPGPLTPKICPWVFVYNDRGKTKLFLNKEEMIGYDEKFGQHLLKSIFTKKNLPVAIIGMISVIAVIVGASVFASKRKKKQDEEEKQMLAEIESEAGKEDDVLV